MIAKFALAGHEVHRGDAGDFLVCRWGLTRWCADLDALQLWRPQPEDVESGPSEDPDDTNVDLDADEGLMWPDSQKVEAWWAANAGRFQKRQRYFMGAPVTWEHCLDVLKHGYQRQRILAAHYLCLLNPGTPLFNTSAPAWRQQRLLAKMS